MMKGTALGAEKENINFISEAHGIGILPWSEPGYERAY